MTVQSCCTTCGQPFDRIDGRAQCLDCRPRNRTETTASQRTRDRITHGNSNDAGYDYRWRRLSERARRLQPFCSDCGSPDDLTTDHSPEAWRRRELGLPIRLRDVDVVCRRCNAERGPARGELVTARPEHPLPELDDLDGGGATLDDRRPRPGTEGKMSD